MHAFLSLSSLDLFTKYQVYFGLPFEQIAVLMHQTFFHQILTLLNQLTGNNVITTLFHQIYLHCLQYDAPN